MTGWRLVVLSRRAPVWATTEHWQHGGDGQSVAGGGVSGKGRMEAIMTEYYHCVGLDGRHGVQMSAYCGIVQPIQPKRKKRSITPPQTLFPVD